MKERIAGILREADTPLSTNEVARKSGLWRHEAGRMLSYMKKRGEVMVTGQVPGEHNHSARMNLWKLNRDNT